METPPEPDAFEKRLRFICGFVFGGLMASLLTLRELDPSAGSFWAVVASVAVGFGLLAVRYGDEFWRGILSLF